ncbi:hypothetical protein P171DRAFT_240449, partial [Karstenula rhodostoma CBS 690.94]
CAPSLSLEIVCRCARCSKFLCWRFVPLYFPTFFVKPTSISCYTKPSNPAASNIENKICPTHSLTRLSMRVFVPSHSVPSSTIVTKMTTNILLNPRKLKLNTLPVPSDPHHRRSQNQLYTPSVRHHPGKRISSIIPCTCSDPHILSHPGKPCLVEILSPSPESLFRRSKRYGLVSPLSSRSSSSSLSSDSVEEEVEHAQDGPAFRYYLPHISSNSVDYYTDASWVAFDMRDANERAETEEMLLGDFDLPFVDEDDFNYYPGKSLRPLSAAEDASAGESLVLGDELEEAEAVKSVRLVEKVRRKFGLRDRVGRLSMKLSCKR